jgi:hypothetical protein
MLDPADDVVNGDVDELDEEADESHDGESDGGGDGDLLELLPVRLCASLHQPDRVLAELPDGLDGCGDLIHVGMNLCVFSCVQRRTVRRECLVVCLLTLCNTS